LCDVQITSVAVHGEQANGVLAGSWTTDPVKDLLHFILVRTDLDKKNEKAEVIAVSLTAILVNMAKQVFVIFSLQRSFE